MNKYLEYRIAELEAALMNEEDKKLNKKPPTLQMILL